MELYISVDDFCVQKVLASASYAGLNMIPIRGIKEAELLKIHPQAKSMALKTDDGCLTQHLTLLRFVSEMCPQSLLSGETEFETAQVNQWLDFSWMEIDVIAQLLLSSETYLAEANLSTGDKLKVNVHAAEEVTKKLSFLDSYLVDKTFMVGEQITLADISICCTIFALAKAGFYKSTDFQNFHRYFMTVLNEPRIATVLGDSSFLSSPSSPVSSIVKSEQFVGKWQRHRVRIKEVLAEGAAAIGKNITVKGWIRTSRSQDKGKLLFIELNDGSTVRSIQLVLTAGSSVGIEAVEACGGAGASLAVSGTVVASPAKGQTVEVAVATAEVVGVVMDPKSYPMAKKQHTLEYLREKAHLRPRSKMFSSAMRMRHAMAFATHKFFNDRGFVYVHTPLITAADCEGAGEQFSVTSMLPASDLIADIPKTTDGKVDFSKDFFGRRTSLTVSGQLNVETHACALSDVYTFGPTFRAENSHTSRHLAEFWMIEPEICFADIQDDAALAEDYVRFCAAYALEHCADDLAYFEDDYPAGEKGLRARLRNVVDSDFERITYTDAVALLQAHVTAGSVTFDHYPQWGDDLGSEHERYMTDKVFLKPTIVFNYPKGIKAFYMRMNEDDATVAAMDILVPKIGELIGGSQREERLDRLEKRAEECGLHPKDLWWYLDLRKYGSVPHAGFGLGFERLIMFVTGLENIRDVIPFPRVPGHADF